MVHAVGANITDFAVGDAVFVNPNANPGKPIGGGELGALAELLLIEDCVLDTSLQAEIDVRWSMGFPDDLLNDPSSGAIKIALVFDEPMV